MAQRTAQEPPKQPAKLTSDQKHRAILRLKRRRQQLVEFDPRTAQGESDPHVVALGQALDRTLIEIFGSDTIDYERYKSIAVLGNPWAQLGGMSIAQRQRDIETDKAKAIAIIDGIIAGFEEDLEEPPPTALLNKEEPRSQFKVFVVHGHDEGALQAVARFLDTIGLKASVLREQPDQGRTIIEKFEACAREVGFAVVLLTPDDIGGAASAPDQAARARQNVIFELGYFVGSLGRGRACLLRKGAVEIPSDLFGVIYSDFDHPAEGWKVKLARELKAAGFEFDSAKVVA